MKKTLAMVAGAMTALGVFAQGEIYMYNNNPILDLNGNPAGPATGGTYEAELVIDSGIPTQTGPVAIAESISPVNSGFFSGPGSTGIFDLDGTQGTPVAAPGIAISYRIEAWSGAPSYAAALAAIGGYGVQIGGSALNTYILGGALGGGFPPVPPAPLDFATFQMGTGAVPEPTTLALGAIGLGAVLMFCSYPPPSPRAVQRAGNGKPAT